MGLLPSSGLPPHVQDALKGDRPVFAVPGRRYPLAGWVALSYGGLLFAGTALFLAWTTRGGGAAALPPWIMAVAFFAAGVFMLVHAARKAFVPAWFVGTSSWLLVVTRRKTVAMPWSQFLPEVSFKDARGRGRVTLTLRLAPDTPHAKGIQVRRQGAPGHVAMHGLDDAPAVARACMRLLDGPPARDGAPASPAAPAAPLPDRVARLLEGAAPAFAVRGGATWAQRAGALVFLAVLGGVFLLMSTIAGLGAGLIDGPEEGTRTREFAGGTLTTTWRFEEGAPGATALLVAWFLVPLGVAILAVAWNALVLWRRGSWFVGLDGGLLCVEGRDARLVSWRRVLPDVRVRGRDVHVGLRMPPEWQGRGIEPERIVLARVEDPEGVARAMAARLAPGEPAD